MKIAFLCSSVEPGKDGVGDYARRLAGELIRQGHACVMVGLNEACISQPVTESQEIEGIPVPAMRLPPGMAWGARTATARKWLDEFQPDWISLQFVPFGFHPKGLCFNLPRQLADIIGGRPLHWMFHELWVLWSFPLSLRKRILGQCQKIFIRSALEKLRPERISTQLPLYREQLRKIGRAAELLPLHGNIPVRPQAELNWLSSRCAMAADLKQYKAGFFGNILSTLDLSAFAEHVARLGIPREKLLLLSAGKNSPESSARWLTLERKFNARASFAALGELDEREASQYFSALNCGLTSYPPDLMGKSGSVAAMREHGLPVLACGSLRRAAGAKTASSSADDGKAWTVRESAAALLQQLQSENPDYAA